MHASPSSASAIGTYKSRYILFGRISLRSRERLDKHDTQTAAFGLWEQVVDNDEQTGCHGSLLVYDRPYKLVSLRVNTTIPEGSELNVNQTDLVIITHS